MVDSKCIMTTYKTREVLLAVRGCTSHVLLMDSLTFFCAAVAHNVHRAQLSRQPSLFVAAAGRRV